jgi:branched-chain amino acid transport system ATP-binding protein
LDRVYGYFPKLKSLYRRKSGYLSGGEQQMLSIGRALMAQPGVMLLDEPSLGLAPQVVTEIFEVVRKINREQKTTFLIAEQNAYAVLPIANYGYVLQTGKVVLEGPSEVIRNHQDVRNSYLGSGDGAKQNYYTSLCKKWRDN